MCKNYAKWIFVSIFCLLSLIFISSFPPSASATPFSKAASGIPLVNDTPYSDFKNATYNHSWTNATRALILPFTNVMGNYFYLFLFLLPFLLSWFRQETLIISSVWGFLLGGLLLVFLPGEFTGVSILILALAMVGVFFKIFKERM